MEAISRILIEELSFQDIKCKLADVGLNRESRPLQAYTTLCDFYLGIHSHGWGKGELIGASYYGIEDDKKGINLGNLLVESLNEISPEYPTFIDGSTLIKSDFPELSKVKKLGMSGILLEINFHSNKNIALWIILHKLEIAKAIADTIIIYERK